MIFWWAHTSRYRLGINKDRDLAHEQVSLVFVGSSVKMNTRMNTTGK